MPSVTLFSWNLRTAVANNKDLEIPLKYILVPDIPLTVKMEFPVAEFNSINSDPLLIQIMADACKDLFMQTIRTTINPRLRQLDEKCGTQDVDAFALSRKATLAQIETDIKMTSQGAKTAIETRIRRLETEKKQYVGYRNKVIKGTVTTIVGAVAAGAGLAGAVGTGGATLAIAIIAGYRTVMGGYKLIAECWAEAATVQKRIETALKSLKTTYASGKGQGIAREVGISAFNAVTRLPISSPKLANLSTVSSDNDLWRGKLTHLRFLAHEMSVDLNELLLNTQKLKQQLAADPKRRTHAAKLEELEKKINKLLTEGHRFMSMKKSLKIEDAHLEAEKGLEAQKAVTEMITQMKDARSAWVDHWDKIINVLADLSVMAAGYGLTTAPQAAGDLVALAFGVPGDAFGLLNTVQEVGEEFGVDIAEKAKTKTREMWSHLTSANAQTPPPVPPRPPKAAVGIAMGGHRAPKP